MENSPRNTISEVFESTVSNSHENSGPKDPNSIEDDVPNNTPKDIIPPNSNPPFNLDLGGGITVTQTTQASLDQDQMKDAGHPKVVDLAKALSAAQSELAVVMNRNECLTTEVARLQTKCLQLENHASTGHSVSLIPNLKILDLDRGALVSELGEVITEKIKTGFKALEDSFMERVAKEHKAELTRFISNFPALYLLISTVIIGAHGETPQHFRQCGPIMEVICAIKPVKGIAEASHRRIDGLEESVAEVAGAVGKSCKQVEVLLEKVDTLASQTHKAELAPPQIGLISQIRTQLSANSALLNEALKVCKLNCTFFTRTC